ncbi:MAG: DUF2142 domain-containing protein [Aliidongia sp.]
MRCPPARSLENTGSIEGSAARSTLHSRSLRRPVANGGTGGADADRCVQCGAADGVVRHVGLQGLSEYWAIRADALSAQAIGLAVGRGVGLSVLHSYDLARLFGGRRNTRHCRAGDRQRGRNAFVVLVLLSTPMFLFLATSVSQDGLLISVSAVFAVQAARPPSPKSSFRNWTLWSCALLMVMARPPYALLALLLIRGRNGRSSAHWLRAPDGRSPGPDLSYRSALALRGRRAGPAEHNAGPDH